MTENFSSTASLLYVLDLRGSITVYTLTSKANDPQPVTKGKAHVLQSPEPEYTPHSTSCQENKELQRELKDETNEPLSKTSLSITDNTSSSSTLAKRQVVLPLSLKSTKNSILSNRFRLDSPPSSSSIPSGDLATHRSTSNVDNTTTITTHENNFNINNDNNQREEEVNYQKHHVSNSEESNVKDRHNTPHYRSNSRSHRLSGRHGSHHTRTYSEDVPSCRELSEQLDALSLYAEQSEMQSRSMRNRSSSHSNSSFYKHHHHRELRRTNSGRFSESRRDSATDHEPEKEHEHQIITTTTISEEEFDNNPISSTLISASDQSVLQLLQITPREQIKQHETNKEEEYEEQENETKLEDKAQLTPTHVSHKMNSLYNSPGQPHALEEPPEPTPFDVTHFTQETSQSKNSSSSKHHDPNAQTQITLVDNNANNEYKSSLKKLKPASVLESSSEFISNVQMSKKCSSDDDDHDHDSTDIKNSNIDNESNEQMYRGHHVLDSMVDVQVSALTSVNLSSNYNNINTTKLRHIVETRSGLSSGEHPFDELEELEQEKEEEKREEEYKATPPLVPLTPSTTKINKEAIVDMQPEPCERSPARKGDPLLEMEAITHTFDEDNVNYASLALTHINPEQHLRQLTQEQPQLTQHATHKSDNAKSVEEESKQNVRRYDEVNTSHTPQTASMYTPSCSSSSSSSSLPLLSSSSTSGSFSPHFITSTRLLRKSLQEWTHLLTSEVHSMSVSRHSYSDMSTDDNTTTTTMNKNVDAGANSHALLAKKMQVQEQDKELAELSVLLSNALLTLQSHSPSHSARSASHSSTLLDNYDTSTVASFATNTTGNSATANNNTTTTTTTIQTAALQSIISELSHIQEQNSRLESQNAYILRKLGEKQK